ncbi:ATP-binding cassette domain-containing protein [Cohnella suwonensis]|uniref:ATP-binding cassette domain-containing protein n=1 Tax=Cohnella suwonensis TaxID=696072 RepID=A0ABW0M2E1_9BACL
MIEVSDVSKRYLRRSVLKGVTFGAEKGHITCLIGLNGAGKSTLLKAIMGLTPVSGGSILIDDTPPGKEIYGKVSYIPDHLTMPMGMRIAEAFRFMADFYPNWEPKRANELLSFFKLDASDKLGNLSKGTAAKLNLLLGFSLRTEYVLMDEPFSGIDLFSREAIASVFASDLIEDRGVLMTTHEVNEVEHLIDRAVLLGDGKVIQDFDCERMRSEQGKSIVDVMREAYRR